MEEEQKKLNPGNKIANVAIIGLGLIGGSFALALKDKGIAGHIIGTDINHIHEEKALSLGLVDEISPLKDAVQRADFVLLATPVSACVQLLPLILDMVDHQIVTDTGSTKTNLVKAVEGHPKRGRYIPSHPMWGTEFSGPEAAVHGAFTGKAVVLCNKDDSDHDVLLTVENIYKTLGMRIVFMRSLSHDVHVAYVSHISHITSFALANTVLEKEKKEDAIFELASAGFASTVRLAKSPASMWVPILMQNRENVLDVLSEHIEQLKKFQNCIESQNWKELMALMNNANKISKVLDGK